MPRNNLFSKILAVLGTILVCIPLLAPLFFGLLSLIHGSFFRVDYLMPAELFPLVLIGSLLLLWAVLRLRHLRAWGIGTLVGMLAMIGAGGLIATQTGLASGETAEGGWETTPVFGTIVLFIMGIVLMGILGILLSVYVFRDMSPASGG